MPEKMTVLITKDGLARLKRYADAGDQVANDAIEAFNFTVLSDADAKEFGL